MRITVDKNQSFGKANPMIYGHFLEHFHRQVYEGVYDPTSIFADEDGFRSDVIDALKKIKTPVIRWPGGCFVSDYKWKLGVGKERIPSYDKAWLVEESNRFGTDEFVKLCRKIGCEPYICTNAGTGSAEEMSDWVEYCNLKEMGRFAKQRIENGSIEPFGIKYWSIGNENYGGWEIGAKESAEWGRLVAESAKMMLRVDPAIELSAASINDLNWNIDLLRKAGRYLKWISIHSYFEGSSDGLKNNDYNTLMLRTGQNISENIDRARSFLTALDYGDKIKIAYDEWNLRGWYHPNVFNIYSLGEIEDIRKDPETVYRKTILEPRNNNDVNSTYSMADAVFSAAFLNTCLRNCDIIGMACFSPVVNTRGAIFTHKDGIVLRPQYFVFELYANLLKDNVLNIWKYNVPRMTGLDGNTQKSVDTVDIVVTYGNGEYAIGAVNKDPDNDQTVDISFLDDTVKTMRVHTVKGKDVDSYNDIGKTDVKIEISDQLPFRGTVTLAPHSVNVIELK
ncbi:MAG: alpha-N-arabinofuranosidase [Clostridia bacterium]|nr:alpha-N-arabinofuranosidase [Clostridia bacterium]